MPRCVTGHCPLGGSDTNGPLGTTPQALICRSPSPFPCASGCSSDDRLVYPHSLKLDLTVTSPKARYREMVPSPFLHLDSRKLLKTAGIFRYHETCPEVVSVVPDPGASSPLTPCVRDAMLAQTREQGCFAQDARCFCPPATVSLPSSDCGAAGADQAWMARIHLQRKR